MVRTAQDTYRLYEQPVWGVAPGEVLRPGGMALTERALDYCALSPGARVLDLGCGTGAAVVCAASRGLALLGIDRSALLLQRAHTQHPGLPLVRAAAERLPIADGTIDVVLAECSLSVCADDDLVLAECERVLKPGGTLAIHDVYARSPDGIPALRHLLGGSCLGGARSAEQVAAQIEAHHFGITLWEDHSALLRPFAAQMGSNGDLMGVLYQGPVEADPFDIQLAIARARLGYFLLVAQKGA